MQGELMLEGAVAEGEISILRSQFKYLVTDIIYDNVDFNFYFPTVESMIFCIVFISLRTHLYYLHIQHLNSHYIVHTKTQLHYDTTYNTITTTLFRNKGFLVNLKTERNASKFAGRHRPGHS